MSRTYLFVILAKHGNTLQCEEFGVFVCVYIYIYIYIHLHKQSPLLIIFYQTSCCISPLSPTVSSVIPFHPPSFPHTVNSSKPSQPLNHRPALQQLTPANNHNNYIHRPVLTQLTPANHYLTLPSFS